MKIFKTLLIAGLSVFALVTFASATERQDLSLATLGMISIGLIISIATIKTKK